MYAMIAAISAPESTWPKPAGMIPGAKPSTTFALGSTIDSRRYASSTVTVVPPASVSCFPNRPSHVGPMPADPSVVWQPVQPAPWATVLPCAGSGGTTVVGGGVGASVGVGVGVAVGVAVAVGLGVGVAVGVGTGVGVGVVVGVRGGVALGVGLGAAVGVGADVAVGAGLGVTIAVAAGVSVARGVGLGVAVAVAPATVPGVAATGSTSLVSPAAGAPHAAIVHAISSAPAVNCRTEINRTSYLVRATSMRRPRSPSPNVIEDTRRGPDWVRRAAGLRRVGFASCVLLSGGGDAWHGTSPLPEERVNAGSAAARTGQVDSVAACTSKVAYDKRVSH